MFKYFNHLGGRGYYWIEDSRSCFFRSEDCIANSSITRREIDSAAVLGILMKNYAMGTRTLIKGIKRTPWMARPDGQGGWESADLPLHSNCMMAPEEVALELGQRLRVEALEFIDDKQTIGILLSGGMDSRIVAGVIRRLQETGDFSGDVVALTWGVPNSRDVVYAQKIAKAFGWEFKHFPLSPEGLARNIQLAAERGAEYSPVHLHAMEAVSKTVGLDGVLAGSYGDSIGRGEYSGRSVNQLPRILDKHFNHFAFLRCSAEKPALSEIQDDLITSRQRFPGRGEAAYREIEMQIHYMRRQLNACMEVIDDRVALYQMFGSPEVFGFMWSLAPESRTDEVYAHLLTNLPKDLHEIPWARTGKKYNQAKGTQKDTFTKINNRYGEWLRNDLRSFVLEAINRGELQKLGIFNERSLAMWSKRWPADSRPKANRLDEKMAWLASLAIFVEKNNIQGVQQEAIWGPEDALAQTKAYVHTSLYHWALKCRR